MLSLITSEITSTKMEASTITPIYVSMPSNEKIINEIRKKIEEAKEEANGQDMDVIEIEIDLSPINSKHYLSILEDIHNTLVHSKELERNCLSR
ncbi:hypothetical protein RCL_jg11773.t1 [Rhizophagus clarus]|uniref:Uncharacterized protein n=1 Tax=Rhizophagus clarus TaxID=94130 RepID=A0A8H3MHE0_9GLOM|nr:hypothetical protein RCL_jg11773.t1 [Rhizophagus clarus]